MQITDIMFVYELYGTMIRYFMIIRFASDPDPLHFSIAIDVMT
jgi:hypothetical protein